MTSGIHKLWPAAALVIAVSSVPVLAHDEGGHVNITNLKYGLVCGQGNNQRICFQTSDIQITGEGRCFYNQKSIACTWYGYSFDYQLPKDTVTLDCFWSSNVTINVGNPTTELKQNANSDHYTLELKRSKYHFFNPQYSSVASGFGKAEELKEQCSYNGEKLFEFVLRLHYPEL